MVTRDNLERILKHGVDREVKLCWPNPMNMWLLVS